MARTYYFANSLRKLNIAFMSLFTDIKVAKNDASGNLINYREVPLVFGHKKKFITKIQKTKQYNQYLPIMSVLITGLSRNPSKNRGGHLNTLTKYFNGTPDSIDELLGGVPYTVNYSLSIITQSLTEAEMILEQILPQFTPYETVTIKEFSFLPQFTRDIKINLVGVEPDFIEEVDEGDIRRIEVNLEFEADIWFYRPFLISDIVKTVKAELYDSTLVPETSAVLLETYTYAVSGDTKDYYDVTEDGWS